MNRRAFLGLLFTPLLARLRWLKQAQTEAMSGELFFCLDDFKQHVLAPHLEQLTHDIEFGCSIGTGYWQTAARNIGEHSPVAFHRYVPKVEMIDLETEDAYDRERRWEDEMMAQ